MKLTILTSLSQDCRGNGALLRPGTNPGGQTRPAIVTKGSTGYEKRFHEFQGPRKIPKTRRKCWELNSMTNSFMKNPQNAGEEIKSCRDNRLFVHPDALCANLAPEDKMQLAFIRSN